ncbi:small integral membrane protein 24 isoform X2 [Entelurus aequoreus]|uniref:small integral membrane protein 24 isoform X2 n=1 Tax=Entelurus aequoreus TaxID=161455 RepID=UPI002B1E2E1D|nr:small integral membrane protein 24 isoform X2 [Entelurus aequoreus]
MQTGLQRQCAGARAARGSVSVTLQPWLTGLTAVVVFLFLVFVIVVVRRLLQKNRREEDKQEEMFGCENKVVEMEEDDVTHTYF